LTFEDREGTARFNGENTVALQVSKRKGYNLIDTVTLVREIVAEEKQNWPEELQEAIVVGTSNDQSFTVDSMVSQLEGSVLTAIALVMIVVLASLGLRPALLVGFAIPTSFLLCFAFLAVMGISVSNIVMFGLILAVGMLVDGAIVVVEYADRRMSEGEGPMRSYVEAAKRMFWPIVSSTATTLCAFLPMLFWPGVPGEFMGMLPVTLIFVLSASLVVALIYLPVMGGVSGRLIVWSEAALTWFRSLKWYQHILVTLGLGLVAAIAAGLAAGAMYVLTSYWGWAAIDLTKVSLSTILGLAAAFALGVTVAAPAAVGAGIAAAMVISLIVLTERALKALAMLILLPFTAIRKLWKDLVSKPVVEHVEAGNRRSLFGRLIYAIAGNPVMPLISIGAVGIFVVATFSYFGQNNNGVEFFVTTEPEQAIVYVQARGNMSISEKDALVKQVEDIILDTPGIDSAFAFAGAGGLNANTGGASGPLDAIGQVQIELTPWNERPRQQGELWGFFRTEQVDPAFDGDTVIKNLESRLAQVPGIKTDVFDLSRGPASGKPLHLRLAGDSLETLGEATRIVRAKFEETPALIDFEDTLPLPGIDWEIDVDVEKAGRYGADVATVGAMVQLVTRGILLDTMRVDSSDEEIEIRVRLPEQDRVLSTLDTLKVRTTDGLVPLSNFITRKPVAKLDRIDRVDQSRIYDVKADVAPGLFVASKDDVTLAVLQLMPEEVGGPLIAPNGDQYSVPTGLQPVGLTPDIDQIRNDLQADTLQLSPITANERIALLTEWLESETPLPPGISWEWTGDQEDQEESGAFLQQAFAGALGLMFIILLAQFNSFYNATLVLLAVVLSTAGVLIGMLVMNQPFSIIMTGTGIVALAGIVVNNNIVLIDTYQEYSRYMPRIEAITRTAEVRIRPVLLTTITTMAGLAPMMFGLSLDFFGGGYTIDSPTALWWKQLATAVVFGLGIATVLTLVFTPSMLALRVWVTTYARWVARALEALSLGRQSRAARDWALQREARRIRHPEIIWGMAPPDQPVPQSLFGTQDHLEPEPILPEPAPVAEDAPAEAARESHEPRQDPETPVRAAE
ncbi:MAG: efflux RND transporter permease subunit, partial [Pseudomonadota bacterium]